MTAMSGAGNSHGAEEPIIIMLTATQIKQHEDAEREKAC